MSDSRIFVGLKSAKKKSKAAEVPTGPQCQWHGCEKVGTHRAPVGAGGEGLFLMFCLDHIKEYNKGYNFSPDLSDPVVARYQRDAISGARPSFGKPIVEATELPMPFTVRSGSAKSLNARKSAAERLMQKREAQARKLKVLEAKAFETLGLPHDATPDQINRRYKERIKLHHPDSNAGNRASEAELQATIEAHKILKLNGFCG
ncbi:J domain-containing protein [Rhizobium sp. DKSPLA3]|uniref:J domain-containing protein n=1 Tax=Rhizobium quercicola TaxID=2901226 RepID=A0A9X1NLU1_9HYPH|nr:J domain-containing protein [Rhizobium quercicola]MCD7107482.1 J domain-containing protein [Rhizobium quercicola]